MGKDRSGQDAKLVGEARWKVSEVQPWGGGQRLLERKEGLGEGREGQSTGGRITTPPPLPPPPPPPL